MLPIHIRGSFEVLGKGRLLPRHAPVEVRIGRVLTAAELQQIAQGAEGSGAYRKLADYMRAEVINLGQRRPCLVPAQHRTSEESEPAPASLEATEAGALVPTDHRREAKHHHGSRRAKG